MGHRVGAHRIGGHRVGQRLRRGIALVAAGVLVAVPGTGCAVREDLDLTFDPSTSVPANTVLIVDGRFVPAELTVTEGETVTWVNLDGRDHRVVSVPTTWEANVLDSGVIGKDAAYSHTFRRPGTYPYYCEIHNYLKGTVTVRRGRRRPHTRRTALR